MTVYWISLEVTFGIPLPSHDDPDRPMVGFMQQFAVTASSNSEAVSFVRSIASSPDWFTERKADLKYEISEILDEDMQSEIYDDSDIMEGLIQPVMEEGVFYHTGRAFYPEDSDDSTDDDAIYEVKATGMNPNMS